MKYLTPFVVLLALVGPAAAQDRTVILDTGGYWRTHFTYIPPVVVDGKKADSLSTFTGQTPLPPKDWASADFDDSQWFRAPGLPLPGVKLYKNVAEVLDQGYPIFDNGSPALGLMCLRGKFNLADPAAAKDLKLSLNFRGGAAVYLNGQEIGRFQLDKNAAPDALAQPYPDEAFFGPDGGPLPGDLTSKTKQLDEVKRRFTLRQRTAELPIPPAALRKGENVLAIEIHRTAYPKAFADAVRAEQSIPRFAWSTCGIVSMKLDAASAKNVAGNATRPKGLQVWNSSILVTDFDGDFGDPSETLRPVRMVGTLGGACSGKVVVGSDAEIKKLQGKVAEFQHEKGSAKIAASTAQVRYGLPTGWEVVPRRRFPVQVTPFDGLSETTTLDVPVRELPAAPATKEAPNFAASWPASAVCPVWVTLSIPADATPGKYRSTLTISADGAKTVEVPLELEVAAWKLPAPSQWTTVVDFIQSPESVALQYGVELYSDKHWKLMERSVDQLGYLGNWSAYIPLICQTNQGNAQSMVRWIPQPDGSYKYDFTVMDRYLDMVEQRMGKPRIVVLYVWDIGFGGVRDKHQDGGGADIYYGLPGHMKPVEIPVTSVDAAGKVTTINLPDYTSPKSAAAWQPLVKELKARFKKRGIDGGMMIGMASDGKPTKEILQMLAKIWPEVPWARGGHFEWKQMPDSDVPLGLQTNVRPAKFAAKPLEGQYSMYGWSRPELRVQYMRTTDEHWPSVFIRQFAEVNIQGWQRGVGRIGLDFWPVLKDAKGKATGRLIGRYPDSTWRQLDAMIKSFVPPGPEGALGSAKLELMREGLQESEARIVLEKALKGGKLKGDLAKRCEEAIAERGKFLMPLLEFQQQAGFENPARREIMINGAEFGFTYNGDQALIYYQWYPSTAWQDRTATLFNLAAEVSK